MSCPHGNDFHNQCVRCLQHALEAKDAEWERECLDHHDTRMALGRTMRTIKTDVFHIETWPEFEGDFLDGVCDLLKELGKEDA